MAQTGIDDLARALAGPRSRRHMLVAIGTAVLSWRAGPVRAAKDKNESFSRSCRRFTISAGPDQNDRFRHIDDDLMIELLPKRGGRLEVIFNDDNDSPNGPDGSHPKVEKFSARVGDRIRIIARNEVAGGCELDEIWLHCVDEDGGRVKLNDAITPEDCSGDADTVGVFFDQIFRIKNK
jgi:hypothetical protein